MLQEGGGTEGVFVPLKLKETDYVLQAKKQREGSSPGRTEGDRRCITGKETEGRFVPLKLKETAYVLQERKNPERVRPLEN